MKHLTSHSKTSLFLMEMIISLLILSLTSCICVQIFASVKNTREQARTWNHIQEMTVNVGEYLEGCDGIVEEFLTLYPNGILNKEELYYFYDSNWNPSDESEYRYYLKLRFKHENRKKSVLLTFFNKEEFLYEREICFPLFTSREEAITS